MKNPGWATVLSFFFAGLGQIYNGEIGKGLLFLIVQLFNFLLTFVLIGWLTAPVVWVWGIVDAYRSAEKHNAPLLTR